MARRRRSQPSALRFELANYGPNVEAGEDVRNLPVRDGQWPTDIPRDDFWLVDSTDLWDMHYAADGTAGR